MGVTYYEYTANYHASVNAPSGEFHRINHEEIIINIDRSSPTWGTSDGRSWSGIDISGNGVADFVSQYGFVQDGNRFLSYGSPTFRPTVIFDTAELSGVTDIGAESSVTDGRYRIVSADDQQTFTPAKAGYVFSPASFTFNAASGGAAYVTFTAIEGARAENPSPEHEDTNIARASDLLWEAGLSEVNNYDVYFGPTADSMVLVAEGLHSNKFSIQDYINIGVDPEDPTVFLDLNTEYFWVIDSYVDDSLVAPGEVWSYTTRAQRSVVLLSPDNLITEQLVGLPITWEIDGIGAQYGSFMDQDYLFIYLRADDANFTGDDLIGNFVQAFYNDSLFISQLKYGTTYFWQIQAANTSADLSDSEVWEFSTIDFYPPAPSFDSGLGYITGRSNMTTVKRVIAAANGKIWYEEDNG